MGIIRETIASRIDFLRDERDRTRRRFVESLSTKQYTTWSKELRQLRSEFYSRYNDARGLRWENLNIDKVTKSKQKQRLFWRYVKAYRTWLHVDNRLEFEVIEGEGQGSGRPIGLLEAVAS